MPAEPDKNEEHVFVDEPEIGELPQNVHDELERARGRKRKTYSLIAIVVAIAAVTAVATTYGTRNAHLADAPVKSDPADTALPAGKTDEYSKAEEEIPDAGASYVDSVIAAQINGPPFSLQDLKDVADKFVDERTPVDSKKLNESANEQVSVPTRESVIKTLSKNPMHARSWGRLGIMYATNDDLEKAVACFEIRYTIARRDTVLFLKALRRDKNTKLREAAVEAIEKIHPPDLR